MQDEDYQTARKAMILKSLGEIIHEKRIESKKGINTFSYEYDIGNGLLSHIEKGKIDSKISTLWKLSNAFGYKCSEFVSLIEERLPKDFNFYD